MSEIKVIDKAFAIIGCFNEFRIDKWNKYEIAEMAYQSERLMYNISGGWQDQYATVFGGINLIEFKKHVTSRDQFLYLFE